MVAAQLLVNIAMLAGLYAIIGVGFSLVYGVMNVLNVAYGAFIMIGAYVTFTLFSWFGIDPLLSIPVSMLALFVLGFGIQKYLLNPIVQSGVFLSFIFTFGLDIFLINGVLLTWGGEFRTTRPWYAGESFVVQDLAIPYTRLAVLIIAVVLIVLLFWLMSRTRLGMAIKATALQNEGAQLMGIDIKLIYALTFAISAALAGAAGSLLGTILPISPFVGEFIGIKAFAVAVLGGLGSVTGALLGAVVLATAEVVGILLFGGSWSEAIIFIILLLALVFRPLGLLGKEYFGEVEV
jgi:branched-chain amino acid transport system permease protein